MDLSPPWDCQSACADWLSRRQYGYIGHQVGCGKSRTLLMSVRDCRALLICCPIAVGPAWAKQGRLFDSGRRFVVAVSGSPKARADAIREAAKHDGPFAVVVNYDSVYRGEVGKAISSITWDAISLDEAHRIKSPNGKASKWLAKLAQGNESAKRVCMSGTPTPNNPLDWWAQFRFLSEGVLGGSYRAFRERIANTHPKFPGWVTGFKPQALEAMRQRIDQHVHRVRADEVLTLPDAIHQTIEVELSPVTRVFYDHLEREMIARLESGEVVTAANRMVVVNRLHLAAGGFARADGHETFSRIDGDPAKRLALREFLEDFPKDEPLVVFVRFLEDLKEVTAECVASGRKVSLLCGHTKQLEAWQAGQTDVIVVQQQAGGAGVDCTRASYCIFYSVSHSLGDFEQAVGRLHRPGQKRCVRYYHLVATDTVDETIYEAIENKSDVVESILSRLSRRVGV